MPGGCRGRRAATLSARSLLLSGGPTLLRSGLCFASPNAAPGGSVAAGDFWAINYLIPSSHVVFSPARSPPPGAQAPVDGSGAGQGDTVPGQQRWETAQGDGPGNWSMELRVFLPISSGRKLPPRSVPRLPHL